MYQHGPYYRLGHAILLARLHCRQPAAGLRDVAHRLIALLDRRSSVSLIICVEARSVRKP
jgi:hypothetical protein